MRFSHFRVTLCIYSIVCVLVSLCLSRLYFFSHFRLGLRAYNNTGGWRQVLCIFFFLSAAFRVCMINDRGFALVWARENVSIPYCLTLRKLREPDVMDYILYCAYIYMYIRGRLKKKWWMKMKRGEYCVTIMWAYTLRNSFLSILVTSEMFIYI